VVDPGHPRVNEVNQREENQQKRIANGINNGSVNPNEAANLEKREASVQKQESNDMAKHNGHLTKAEQNQLNRRQNRISKSIYKDKHNNK
jgi:CRISPR/Cas system-associated endoribonuclease Cas2